MDAAWSMYSIRYDPFGLPVAIECDGVDVVHLAPSTRSINGAKTLVMVLNNAQVKVDWRKEFGLEERA